MKVHSRTKKRAYFRFGMKVHSRTKKNWLILDVDISPFHYRTSIHLQYNRNIHIPGTEGLVITSIKYNMGFKVSEYRGYIYW